MANGKRLIDANALTDQIIANFQIAVWDGASSQECQLALETIEDAPTVDAVEVVRCEDCKYFGHNIENDTYCRCTGGLSDPEENDFCSYGERRTDGN